jgi:hypothetical protein
MKHLLPGNETPNYRDMKHLLPGFGTPFRGDLPGNETPFSLITSRGDKEKGRVNFVYNFLTTTKGVVGFGRGVER